MRVKELTAGAGEERFRVKAHEGLKEAQQALLKRLRSGSAVGTTLESGSIVLDKSTLSAKLDGQRLDLTTTEFKLLTAFLNNPARTLSRDLLLKDVWGYASGADTRTVDTHIRRLREKLGDHADRLETVGGEHVVVVEGAQQHAEAHRRQNDHAVKHVRGQAENH